MYIRTKRIKGADRMGEWYIYLSDKEMQSYGLKYGYCNELIYTIDTIVKDIYQGYIGLGYNDRESYGKNGVIYSIKTGIDMENDKRIFRFTLQYKRVNGEEELIDKVYEIKTSWGSASHISALKSFVRCLIKDGYLSFWESQEE